MSSKWEPDDSILETGHERIKEATGVSEETGIVTSRDEGRGGLPGRDMPQGFRQELVPLLLPGKMLAFKTRFEPDAELPSHSHDSADIFRVVLGGSLFHEGQELRSGDWMFVKRGEEYALRAGPDGVDVMHLYIRQ